jgi:hypothetical protein
MADTNVNDYVVGRGRLFFGQFKPGTRTKTGQRYFGNTPELSLAQDEETLDHYSSEGGVRVKDASVSLQNDSSGSFQCDNINDRNLALWFRGDIIQHIEAGSATATGSLTFSTAVPVATDSVSINGNEIVFVVADPVGMEVLIGGTIAATAANLANFINDTPALGVTATVIGAAVTVTATGPGTGGNSIALLKDFATAGNMTLSGATLTGGTDVEETLVAVERGLWYQLGVTPSTPQGVRGVGTVTITGVSEDSFVIEGATGRIYLNSDADDIVDGDDLEVAYGVSAAVEDIVIAKGETIEGEMQFLANNATGTNRDYYWPYVKLTPDGDFALKGDDWQNMTFNFEILKRDELVERQYITKRAATVVA